MKKFKINHHDHADLGTHHVLSARIPATDRNISTDQTLASINGHWPPSKNTSNINMSLAEVFDLEKRRSVKVIKKLS